MCFQIYVALTLIILCVDRTLYGRFVVHSHYRDRAAMVRAKGLDEAVDEYGILGRRCSRVELGLAAGLCNAILPARPPQDRVVVHGVDGP